MQVASNSKREPAFTLVAKNAFNGEIGIHLEVHAKDSKVDVVSLLGELEKIFEAKGISALHHVIEDRKLGTHVTIGPCKNYHIFG